MHFDNTFIHTVKRIKGQMKQQGKKNTLGNCFSSLFFARKSDVTC